MENQPKRKFKKRYILYGFLALIVLGLIQSQFEKGSAGTTAEVNAVAGPVITVSAADLFSDYQANEVSADQKYRGKMLHVSGYVQEIKKDFADDIYVNLKGDGYFMHVRCSLADEKTAAALAKGQYVEFRGRCDGMVVGSVILNDCINVL